MNRTRAQHDYVDSRIGFKSLAIIVAKLRTRKIASKGLNKYRPPSFYRGGKNSPETRSHGLSGEPFVLVRTFSPRYLTASRGRFAKLPPIEGIHASLQRLQRRRLAERPASTGAAARTSLSLSISSNSFKRFD